MDQVAPVATGVSFVFAFPMRFIYIARLYIFEYVLLLLLLRACSSVGIATGYGLDGPRSNPGGDEIFRPSRPGPWGPPSLL
jgi:hypothetical protein